MFLLDGKPLQIDTPFTDKDGNQYPSNWLRFATNADKLRIGITEVEDPVRADDRFYWDGNINNPKALDDKKEEDGSTTKGLKSVFIAQVRDTAYKILLQTDWAVVRKAERAIEIPADITTYRADVLNTLDHLENAISLTTTVEELAALNLSFPSQDKK
jgi:hypothetical protein